MSVPQSDPNVERFQGHALHSALQSALELVTRIIDERSAPAPAEVPLGILRLNRGLSKAQAMLAGTDGAFVSPGVLKEAWRPFSEITNQLNSYAQNFQEGHLNEASTHLETVLSVLQRMPKFDSPQDMSGIVQMLQETEQRSVGALKAEFERLRSDRQEFEKQKAELQATIESTVASLLTSESRFAAKLSEQDERLNNLVQRTDAAVSDFNSRAAEAERSRDQQFSEALTGLRGSIAQHIQDSKQEFALYRADLNGQGSALLDSLEEYKRQAADLLQVMGEIGVASPFDKTARADRRAAMWLRWLAGGFFAGMAGIVVWTAIQITAGDLSWQHLVFRFMTALILAVPAYYFARESSKFQDEADRNRRLQLELAVLGPFLENLEPPKRFELREKLTEKYFGGAHQPRELEKPIDADRLFDLLTEFAKGAKR